MKRLHHCVISLAVILGCVVALTEGASLSKIPGGFNARGSKSASRPAAAEHPTAQSSSPRIGIISYWQPSSPAWDRVPAQSVVLINPESGILEPGTDQPVSDLAEWVKLVARLKKNKIVVIGYVPTGYFDHETCKKTPAPKCQTKDRIRLQVKTYYKRIPSLDGIFYDETSPKEGVSADYKKEYKFLRSLNLKGRITVFNVGTTSAEALAATNAREHLVLFENSGDEYDKSKAEVIDLTREARKKGVVVWHLLHTVTAQEKMCSYVAEMAQRGADYGYVTNIENGDLTWDSLPSYWDAELEAFSAPGNNCLKK
jgi:hypothetical protein